MLSNSDPFISKQFESIFISDLAFSLVLRIFTCSFLIFSDFKLAHEVLKSFVFSLTSPYMICSLASNGSFVITFTSNESAVLARMNPQLGVASIAVRLFVFTL